MDIQLPQILFQVINFSVVLGALTYLLYNPIQKILDERAQRVEHAQKAAAETVAEKANIEKIKQQAEDDIRQMHADAMKQAAEQAKVTQQELLEKAHQEAQDLIKKEQLNWKKQEAKLAAEMREEFSSSVMMVVEKILGTSFDKKTHNKLIETELKSMLNTL